MRFIKLTQGKFATVDDSRYNELSAYKWKAVRAKMVGDDKWYAYREDSQGRLIGMHQDVLGAKPDRQIDHRDRNGLNNQEANLRYATPVQNGANRVKQPNASSQYKGVTLRPARWVARIKVGDRIIHLGTFEYEVDAAKAYDNAAKQHLGEFHRLNFP